MNQYKGATQTPRIHSEVQILLGLGPKFKKYVHQEQDRTRTRTNTNPNDTEANAAGRSGNARALRASQNRKEDSV
jgi:uncharacterized MAPEG superfamily protein